MLPLSADRAQEPWYKSLGRNDLKTDFLAGSGMPPICPP